VIDMVFTPARPVTEVTHLASDDPPSLPPRPDRARPGQTVDDQPVADLSRAPLPSRSTLRRRRSLPRQAIRFVAFNAKILRMVVGGHHSSR
jgi:hypothetical protein